MYERYFGLRECPFAVTPNPRFLVLTPAHQEALSNIEYGIRARKGITLLLGEAGTGKTTLLRKALSHRMRQDATPADHGWVYINNPALTRQEFLEVLAAGFGLTAAAHSSKAALLRELEAQLRTRLQAGAVSALIVDEAQSLTFELLEELRLLANIESDTQKLLPLVLAGQPELGDRLNDPALRQFKQRIVLRCEVAPFTLRETALYIAARIRTAGGDPARLFTRDAVVAVHDAAGGIPRTISVICDNVLLAAFAADVCPADRDLVEEISADFDLAAGERRSPTEPEAAWWRAGRRSSSWRDARGSETRFATESERADGSLADGPVEARGGR